MSSKVPSIPEFYRNKTIFITGGSGFIGKVLIEKLLRSCPDLKAIYLLMRPKKEKTPHERIKAITDLALFDLLKSQNPAALDKIKLVPGDVKLLNLGLTPEDRRLLIQETNIIFHGAASVRFDDSLTDAVLMNTRGTREVVQLALQVENLEAFVHISTTFCNVDRLVIGEQIYPPHADWEKTIEIVENVDKHTLNVLTDKYIAPLPNTYTFSKSLAEHVVYDLVKGRVPAVIFRPSIVISSLYEPMPGWIDNFNGPVGLMIAIGKGVVRTVRNDPEVVLDYIPVDLIVKAIIASTWKQATIEDEGKLEISFYNGSNNNVQNVNLAEITELGEKIIWEIPLNYTVWYPHCVITKCVYYYWIIMIFTQLLPAVVLDGVLKLLKYEPLLMKVQRRVYISTIALEHFFQDRWKFLNDNSIALESCLLPCDIQDFGYHREKADIYEFFKNATLGGKKFLLKETDETWDAKTHNKRMWVLYHAFNFLWYFALFWLIFIKIDIISIMFQKYNDAYVYLTTE